MQIYTYSEARQKLAIVLDQAENSGKVLIRRKDGRTLAWSKTLKKLNSKTQKCLPLMYQP